MKKLLAILALTALLTACATTPKGVSIEGNPHMTDSYEMKSMQAHRHPDGSIAVNIGFVPITTTLDNGPENKVAK